MPLPSLALLQGPTLRVLNPPSAKAELGEPTVLGSTPRALLEFYTNLRHLGSADYQLPSPVTGHGFECIVAWMVDSAQRGRLQMLRNPIDDKVDSDEQLMQLMGVRHAANMLQLKVEHEGTRLMTLHTAFRTKVESKTELPDKRVVIYLWNHFGNRVDDGRPGNFVRTYAEAQAKGIVRGRELRHDTFDFVVWLEGFAPDLLKMLEAEIDKGAKRAVMPDPESD